MVAKRRSASWELRDWGALSEEPVSQVKAPDEYEPKHGKERLPGLPEVPSPR